MGACDNMYLHTVKWVHDAVLHDPGQGTGRHVDGHGVGRQALVVVIHDPEGGESLARKSVPIHRHDVRNFLLAFLLPFLSLSLYFFLSSLSLATSTRCCVADSTLGYRPSTDEDTDLFRESTIR